MIKIHASRHVEGASPLTLTRETREEAARTAELLRDCGYQEVQISG